MDFINWAEIDFPFISADWAQFYFPFISSELGLFSTEPQFKCSI
jgi:hypothetical protein